MFVILNLNRYEGEFFIQYYRYPLKYEGQRGTRYDLINIVVASVFFQSVSFLLIITIPHGKINLQPVVLSINVDWQYQDAIDKKKQFKKVFSFISTWFLS